VATFRKSGFGYFLEQTTRPQTIGYALLDSPIALAAWMIDHDTYGYYKSSRAFLDNQPSGNLTRDHILDNITLYWLTAPAPRRPGRIGRWTSSRPYHQLGPVGGRRPGWVHHVPRRNLPGAAQLGREGVPTLTYFSEVDKGGHFAAWEQPGLFAEAIRAAFRPPRSPR
jgi:pimeloyl-ACP methyl ester carboxylesterase